MKTFSPKHKFLVGIDSDGCVFDSQGVKQIGHFHPMIIRHWGLEELETEVRALGEYLNLRSPMRGTNRFLGLLRLFELLAETNGFRSSGLELPPLTAYRNWLDRDPAPSESSLEKACEATPELCQFLEWSRKLSQDIREHLAPIPPFAGVTEALEKMRMSADLVVVSLTGKETLEEEWTQHGIRPQVQEILGMEAGPKIDQLQMAMKSGNYAPEKVLMIGDAPGDQNAARETGVCFFPTIPGEETECWQELKDTVFDQFLSGTYRGEVMNAYINRFDAALAHDPPKGL